MIRWWAPTHEGLFCQEGCSILDMSHNLEGKTMENGTIAEHPALGITCCGNVEFRWGERTYIMGIIYPTPGSFSGDGLVYDIDPAVARAQQQQ